MGFGMSAKSNASRHPTVAEMDVVSFWIRSWAMSMLNDEGGGHELGGHELANSMMRVAALLEQAAEALAGNAVAEFVEGKHGHVNGDLYVNGKRR